MSLLADSDKNKALMGRQQHPSILARLTYPVNNKTNSHKINEINKPIGKT